MGLPHAHERQPPCPRYSLSDDARFVLRAAQVLRQAGWRGELFLGVKLVDPDVDARTLGAGAGRARAVAAAAGASPLAGERPGGAGWSP